MKLTDALAKSSGVITEESERRTPTICEIESGNMSWLRTPKGVYLFAYTRVVYSRDKNPLRDEFTLSLTRTSYCGRKVEQCGQLVTTGTDSIGKWVEDNKERILHNDFKDRKYILGRVLTI